MPASAAIRSPYCLALTGGIACGKSTVGEQLGLMGLQRVDADQVARQVVEPGSLGLVALVEAFGSSILTPSGALDRAAMGRRVFEDATARARLESILHPLIWDSLSQSMQSAHENRTETVFEIPLLYEKGSQSKFSTVWVVAAPLEVQLRRLQERDGFSEPEAKARVASQMSVQDKAALADFVIVNDTDLRHLVPKIQEGLRLWRRSRSESPD